MQHEYWISLIAGGLVNIAYHFGERVERRRHASKKLQHGFVCHWAACGFSVSGDNEEFVGMVKEQHLKAHRNQSKIQMAQEALKRKEYLAENEAALYARTKARLEEARKQREARNVDFTKNTSMDKES